MRLSTDPLDPGYDVKKARKAVVWFSRCGLTEWELKDCVTADEERGIAIINCRDVNGNFVLDRTVQDGHGLQTKILRGQVRIEIRD